MRGQLLRSTMRGRVWPQMATDQHRWEFPPARIGVHRCKPVASHSLAIVARLMRFWYATDWRKRFGLAESTSARKARTTWTGRKPLARHLHSMILLGGDWFDLISRLQCTATLAPLVARSNNLRNSFRGWSWRLMPPTPAAEYERSRLHQSLGCDALAVARTSYPRLSNPAASQLNMRTK